MMSEEGGYFRGMWLCHDCVYDGHTERLIEDALRHGEVDFFIEFTSERCDCPCHGGKKNG